MSKITSVSRADYFQKHSGAILKFEFGGGWMPLFSALAKHLAAGYTFLAEFHLCVVYPLCPRLADKTIVFSEYEVSRAVVMVTR
jgi:hypothetical protein